MFPTFMFHKDHAPEGKCFQTPADEPAGGFEASGWVDTPAAFEPGYKKPEPVVPEGSVPADAPPGFIPQPFPSWRYKKDGTAKAVATQAEVDALDPSEWKETNDPDAWDDKKMAAKAAAAPADGVNAAEPVVDHAAEAEKLELYALSVRAVERQVSTMTNRDTLEKMRGYEAVNPKGSRELVMNAIARQLTSLV